MTHHWTPDRLIHYPLIEHVNLSPDGRRVLYTVRRAHITDEASEFRRQLFLVDLDDASSEPVALTHGESTVLPQWSPDGAWIAFLRKTSSDGKPGLWLMSARGGEARCLTGAANGVRNAVNSFRWSPDGTRVALVAVPWTKKRRPGARDAMTPGSGASTLTSRTCMCSTLPILATTRSPLTSCRRCSS